LNNEERVEVLIKRYDFDFSEKYHVEIRQLLEKEIINYQNGSVESEYVRNRHLLIDDFVSYYSTFEASEDFDE
jgi:phosphoribosylglycinamide formyltransferase-1